MHASVGSSSHTVCTCSHREAASMLLLIALLDLLDGPSIAPQGRQVLLLRGFLHEKPSVFNTK